MTLKEEIEVLRGGPIAVSVGDPLEIPCNETSDAVRLCRHPVVSVYMITYNHERYIRQAIEGVVMQRTDFEFELVIGEDCSTDRTREICFECQRKHPDKIRVLWSERNLVRNPHPAGGNERRTLIRCRGEFIAFCEGDDYWTDPRKLQKQVDVMRRHGNVGLCFCGTRFRWQDTGRTEFWDPAGTVPKGIIRGRAFQAWHAFGRPGTDSSPITFLGTQTVMLRAADLRKAMSRFDIFGWWLWLGDTPTWLGVAAVADCYYLADEVAVYRRTSTGICATSDGQVWFDAFLARGYFGVVCGLPGYDEWCQGRPTDSFRFMILRRLVEIPDKALAKRQYRKMLDCREMDVFGSWRQMPLRAIVSTLGLSRFGLKLAVAWYDR